METAALHGKSTEFLHLQKAILPATFGFGPSTHFFLKNSVVEFQRLSSEFWTQWAWELSHLKSILKVNMWLACVELFGMGLNETRLEDLKCCQGVHDASRCMMPAGAWCQPVHDASRCMMPIRKGSQSIKQKNIHHQTINQVILFYCFQNKHSLWGCSTPPSNDPFFRMLHVWSKRHDSWPMGYKRMANLWGPWGFFECLGPPSELISRVSGHEAILLPSQIPIEKLAFTWLQIHTCSHCFEVPVEFLGVVFHPPDLQPLKEQVWW